jgi:hypothetical protein
MRDYDFAEADFFGVAITPFVGLRLTFMNNS